MKNNIIRTRNISKKYKNRLILDNINLNIGYGEIYGFIGENGAGKTSLLRILTGLSFATKGSFELLGKKQNKEIQEVRKKIGSIIENPSIYLHMTVRQNLEIQKVLMGIRDRESVDEVISYVSLKDVENRKAKELSLGMKQRLGLAIALLGNPKLLILDEPLNGLDPTGILELRELLKKLNSEKNITILISSHILSELKQIATCYGFIHKGKLIKQISAEELEDSLQGYIEIIIQNNFGQAVDILREEYPFVKIVLEDDNKLMKIFDRTVNIGEVSSALVGKGINIKSIMNVSENLEDYYRRLIGDFNSD